MNAGYLRLSRDDDRRNYSSIENQKLIINQYAASQNITIDRWYEDDGVSGYRFDRPGFCQLMEDLDKDVDSVIVKDFSRLGRHNAKVLLLLDEFQERGKRLIVIDDAYDSLMPDDDVIGIKTWYNEKYVKDTSRKIKRVLGARQKEGSLLSQVPFGYRRNNKNKEIIEIIPAQAEHIRLVYELYLQGSGYRKISAYLTERHIPTPSAFRHETQLAEGKQSKRRTALEWTEGMVRDLLDNDFYTGTYRLHKRTRSTVHGKDKRVPKEEQFIFENHHAPVIDKMTYELVQDIKAKRVKSDYRGYRGKWNETQLPNPFGSCLFCRDCKNRLTPILRKTTCGERKYYICSTYNTKGREYCPKTHLIEEHALLEDIINFLRLCRDTLYEIIAAYEPEAFESACRSSNEKQLQINNEIMRQKKLLHSLLTQKIKDLSLNTEYTALITESYETLQKDILEYITSLELQLQELNKQSQSTLSENQSFSSASDILDEIIKKGSLDRKDIEILIERIEVDENGLPQIKLKYCVSEIVNYCPAIELNRRENEIILTVMKLILGETRGYTSAGYLAAKLTEAGFRKSNKSILPYIALLVDQNLLKPSGNPKKPYLIMKSREEMNILISTLQNTLLPEG